MTTCPTCGADRSRSGILFPARRLCACEARSCAQCTQPAVVVEFQQIAFDFDAALPSVSDRKVKFFCPFHNVSSVKVEIPLKDTSTAPPKPPKAPKAAELQKQVEKIASNIDQTAPKKRRGGKPHISPDWCWPMPPPDATSRTKVECAGCRSTHSMLERRNFNGTKSECPACGFQIFTHANEESHEPRQDC